MEILLIEDERVLGDVTVKGLSIVQVIVKGHGWEIKARNREQGGLKVSVIMLGQKPERAVIRYFARVYGDVSIHIQIYVCCACGFGKARGLSDADCGGAGRDCAKGGGLLIIAAIDGYRAGDCPHRNG